MGDNKPRTSRRIVGRENSLRVLQVEPDSIVEKVYTEAELNGVADEIYDDEIPF